MFKRYRELCDVVSVLVYCPSERCYLLTKEASGELWLPSTKCEKNCWKQTANNMHFELFGMDASGTGCQPLRVCKVWLPHHPLQCVYHVVYKLVIKAEIKKRTKKDEGVRSRLQWYSVVELERQRAHCSLRSPEVALFALMAAGNGEHAKDIDSNNTLDIEMGSLIEICEDNVVVGCDVAGGAVAMASPNYQLLHAANYFKEDQIQMYREFILMVFPALFMSQNVFSQFMIDVGWQRAQCSSLFRAADITGRGGLSFLEMMLWSAALEPSTQHSGVAAEIRCRYIYRYFDSNRDLKLEYLEFKELVAAARAARQLPVDALSVARDADVCLRQLGLQPNSQLPLAEFLRGVGELRLRGTSSLLRSPKSILSYVLDLQQRDKEMVPAPSTIKLAGQSATAAAGEEARATSGAAAVASGARRGCGALARPDYSLALHTVRLRARPPYDMLGLNQFDEDAISPSSTRLIAGTVNSVDVLGPSATPVEALAAVRYFATAIEPKPSRRPSGTAVIPKAAWSWALPSEEATMGSMLCLLAEAVRPICTSEPRLLRLTSPVYVIGDLHGNLAALLSMEASLWPSGPALAAARILFLGDYVDRGLHGTELMAYLLAAKLQRPTAVYMIRGNHETRDIQKMFSFYNECISKYGETEGIKVWNAINNVFDALPLAAVVDDKIFCCHGGIPPPWVCPLITAIDKVPVPLSKPAEQSSIAWELLWNDPVKANKLTASLQLELNANEGFAANAKRGTGHVFDQSALDRFLAANQLSHVLRAHELHHSGFMLRGRLITVFSSYHYCGGTNDSGVALLDGAKLRILRVNLD